MSDTKHRNAVIYCRVSSRSQTKRGDGLSSQEAICREYARYRGYDIIAEPFKDDLTGKTVNRPGMQRLIEFLRTHRKERIVVIVDDVSRLARSMRAHIELRDAVMRWGGRLESPSTQFSDTDEPGLEEGLKALVAQEQRVRNSEQTRDRRIGRLINGFWPFQPPVGYRHEKVEGVAGQLVVRDEPVASIVQEAIEGYAIGRFETQAEVKRFLETRPEFPRDSNGYVRNQRVKDLLTRPIYAGLIECPTYGVTLRKGRHEPLVSVETFQRVQERLKKKAYASTRKDLAKDFILRGCVSCGDCGHALTASWSKGKAGKRYAYYYCFNEDCSSCKKTIRRDLIEGEFEALLRKMKPSKGLIQMAGAMFRDLWDHRLSMRSQSQKATRKNIKGIEAKIEKLLDRLVEAELSSVVSRIEKRIAELEAEKFACTEKLKTIGRPVRPFDEVFGIAMQFLAQPHKLWASNRIEDKRAVLKLTFADRLSYVRGKGFQTPSFSLPFRVLTASGLESEGEQPDSEIRAVQTPEFALNPAALAAFAGNKANLSCVARPERFELPTAWFVGVYAANRFLINQ